MKLTGSAHYSLLLLSSILGLSSATTDHSGLDDQTPCVARSPTSGLYYDLNAISLAPPKLKDGKQVYADDRNESWHAKGYDYAANFTLNVCAPVIEDVQDVVGVEASRWQNVSAYYEQEGKIYSLGYDNSSIVARGIGLLKKEQRTSFIPLLSGSQARPQLYEWLSVSWRLGPRGREPHRAKKVHAHVLPLRPRRSVKPSYPVVCWHHG